jgi:hypothetical protein
MMRTNEVVGRLTLCDRLHALGLMPRWDADGNMTFVSRGGVSGWQIESGIVAIRYLQR